MRLSPMSDYLLCIRKNLFNQDHVENGICYTVENVPEYEVVDTSIAVKARGNFHVGDIVLANSVPTKAKVGDVTYFLVKEENVVGKL